MTAGERVSALFFVILRGIGEVLLIWVWEDVSEASFFGY
jgi:hypothetical protein